MTAKAPRTSWLPTTAKEVTEPEFVKVPLLDSMSGTLVLESIESVGIEVTAESVRLAEPEVD